MFTLFEILKKDRDFPNETYQYSSELKQSNIFCYVYRNWKSSTANFIRSDCNNLIQCAKVGFLKKGDLHVF
ncbi:unnamed protein product [Camellia sinensis]